MFEKVQAIIANELGIDKNQITMESRLAEDLGADSLDIVELLMAFEEEFGVSISDEDASKIKSVNDVVAYIESKK